MPVTFTRDIWRPAKHFNLASFLNRAWPLTTGYGRRDKFYEPSGHGFLP